MSYPMQIGQSLAIGEQTVITGFIVTQETSGGSNIDQEDVDTAAGALSTRIIFKVQNKIGLEVICQYGYSASDFTEGSMCAATAWSNYFVDSARFVKTKGATKITVDMTLIGVTVIT